jgi:hypothetical protein
MTASRPAIFIFMRLFLEFSDQGLAQLAHRLKHQIGRHRRSKFRESAVLAHDWAISSNDDMVRRQQDQDNLQQMINDQQMQNDQMFQQQQQQMINDMNNR